MKSIIRVLQVVTHMNRGGLENMLMNYYRAIDREKVQFDFLTHRLCTEIKDFDDEIMSLGGRIYHLPSLNPLSIQYRRKLDTFLKEHRDEYDIIHVHQDCMSSLILKYAKKNGYRVRIAHSHNAAQDKNFKYPVKLFYRSLIPKYATALFACGIKAGDWMFGHHRYELLYNAIDCDAYMFREDVRDRVRTQLGVGSATVIGHVGRFNQQKNHGFLIDVFEKYIQINSNAFLVLVGVGAKQKDIMEMVNAKGLSNRVLFLGLRDDVRNVLMAMDCFVFPSLFEGVPVTLIEAQASGLPCIISDTISSEVIVTGLVCSLSLEDSSEIWAKKIAKTAASTDREKYCSVMMESRYDIKTEANKLQNYYTEGMHF